MSAKNDIPLWQATLDHYPFTFVLPTSDSETSSHSNTVDTSHSSDILAQSALRLADAKANYLSRPKLEQSMQKATDMSPKNVSPITRRTPRSTRDAEITELLAKEIIPLDRLSRHIWHGIPSDLRPICWQLLLGYRSNLLDRQLPLLEHKRREYWRYVAQYFADSSNHELKILQQIRIDIPRTVHLDFSESLRSDRFLLAIERILYIWAIRHPANGYVQGFNDLLIPFLYVFSLELENEKTKDTMDDIEADVFWSMSKLLDGIQDHFTFGQPGIQRQLVRFHDLLTRIDASFMSHLSNLGIEVHQFAFRWMNCLLVREFPLPLLIRMWDSYFSESNELEMSPSSVLSFSDFHLYVCISLLMTFANDIKRMDEFQTAMLFLQNLPIHQWTMTDVEMLLAEAYTFASLYQGAPSHWKPT